MRICIIGAGFTGTILSVHLLRLAATAIEITLIDSNPVPGLGLAYSTENPDHLLNVRVANMSAFEEDPSHFLRWLWARDGAAGVQSSVPPSGHAFVSRRTYGAYIADVFENAVKTSNSGSTVTVINQAATQMHVGRRPTVTLADNRLLYFDRVVLCVGNFLPATPPALDASALGSKRFLPDPWDWKGVQKIPPEDDVLILGSGLTMADVVQSLHGSGHRGSIQVISRRGLLSQRHEAARPYKMTLPQVGLRQLVRLVRREVETAGQSGYSWRDVVDATRSRVSSIWQKLSLTERQRFLRHLRPYWEVHRHRLAPRVADTIEMLLRTGNLKVDAGRVQSVSWNGQTFDVDVIWRGETNVCRLRPAWIVNCSGPECDYRNIPSDFVQNLLAAGLVRPDALGLGIDVTADNSVINARGDASPHILALGPPTKGAFWECTAVPDIRSACRRIAQALIAPECAPPFRREKSRFMGRGHPASGAEIPPRLFP